MYWLHERLSVLLHSVRRPECGHDADVRRLPGGRAAGQTAAAVAVAVEQLLAERVRFPQVPRGPQFTNPLDAISTHKSNDELMTVQVPDLRRDAGAHPLPHPRQLRRLGVSN